MNQHFILCQKKIKKKKKIIDFKNRSKSSFMPKKNQNQISRKKINKNNQNQF